MAGYPFVHYSAVFLCTFSVCHCDYLYFFMLHFFYPTCCIFLCSNIFLLYFFVMHYFMLHFYTLQSFPFAGSSYCTLHKLQFFPVALCSCVARTSKTSKMESFAKIINKAVKYCCKVLHLRCPRGFWLRCTYVAYFPCCTLQCYIFVHAALFSCCTFSMFHLFHVILFPCCTFSCCTFFMLQSFHVALFP